MLLKVMEHLANWQIFMIFDPYFLPSAVFLLLSVGKFGPNFPLKNADVINGWSLRVALSTLMTLPYMPEGYKTELVNVKSSQSLL